MSNIQAIRNIFKPNQPRRTRRKPQPQSRIYQLKGFKHLAFLKYEDSNLKHFGVFSGDTLKIKRGIEWAEIDAHSLYVVLLPDNSVRVCAIKTETEYRITLHDGLGGNFATFRRFRVELIGLVIGMGVAK